MRKDPRAMRRWLALALFASVACSDPDKPSGGSSLPATTFESDLPRSSSKAAGRDANAGAAEDESAPSTPGGDAERAIVEADIVQVADGRLYALSRVAGLSVIDVTNPGKLAILGRYRELNGTPFEMYLRDGVVLAMYSSWGQYVRQPDGKYAWVQTSKVVALDAANAAAIAPLGSFDVAGEVSDSRLVGDIMYVVGYQNGYCWGCDQTQPQTSILSLDVRDPRQVRKVDQLAFADAKNSYGWSRRSVTVTPKRMYVAGPEHGRDMPTGSTIQVVDISDPAGDLVEGGSVLAAGQISSRWQMDEHEGVLRVISQIPRWWQDAGTARPMVQTFKVESAQVLTPLGSTPLIIPDNETLNTVRFDGPRGYAITSERRDPLFTIDLSDPAKPRQLGEVEMPGWIYHMVPRGNRLIGLGYDQGNAQGAITVSLFDVTNLAAPVLLDRVNFGGDWGYLPEDQDRIHKAFRILDDLGMIVVPFSGWTDARRGSYCSSRYQSGVQLVDLAGDDLVLRGAAPARGQARRAIVQGTALLTVSDEAVDSYDLANRDQPRALGALTIARNVSHALPLANGHVARINEDWYGRQSSTLDLVQLADVDRPDRSVSELDLSALVASDRGCATYTWIQRAFVHENQINLSYQRWGYADLASEKPVQVSGVVTIDASDPQKPAVLSKLERETSDTQRPWSDFYNYYQYGYGANQVSALRTEQALVFLEQRYVPEMGADGTYTYELRLRVVGLADPTHPTEVALTLPRAGGYSGLVRDGGDVLLSHFEETAGGRARFFLDRIDLSNLAEPRIAGKINVPGSLMHYDRAHARLLTSELVRAVVDDVTASDCYARFAYADFEYRGDAGSAGGSASGGDAGTPPEPHGTCTGYREQLHLVRLEAEVALREDTYALADRERISSSSLGDGRVAAVLSHGFRGWYLADDCFRCGGYTTASEPVELLTLGGFDAGRFAVGRLRVVDAREPWWGFWGAPPVHAFGTRALVQSQTDAMIVDMTNPTAPTVLRTIPLYGSPMDLAARDNRVVLALGMNGAQVVDL